MMRTRDRDVRQAIISKVLAEHVADPDVLVVHELGLQHGACRVDIAVVNGFLHGYEIKSDADSLTRLPAQIEAYSASMDRATLVVADRHLSSAEAMVPAWWGIKVVEVGRRGAVNFLTARALSNNPTVSPFHVAQLLWRDEVVALLTDYGVEKGIGKMNRNALYHLAAESVPLVDLRRRVRSALKLRENWRVGPSSPSHGDL